MLWACTKEGYGVHRLLRMDWPVGEREGGRGGYIWML